ncbi:hypothetical protein ABZ667_37505 [Streptomyces lavendulae]|uniref:hypothetical protein n=1 Tax=Streptomyces lavendulae TaxID=1914 RepID=UPI00340AFD2B
MTYVLALVVLALALPWGAARVARRLAALFHVPFLASLERLPLVRVLSMWRE